MFASDQSDPMRFSAAGLSQPIFSAHRGVDLVGALVGVGEPSLHELEDRIVAGVAKLDGPVDVSGRHELFDLGEELLRVHPVLTELETRSHAR